MRKAVENQAGPDRQRKREARPQIVLAVRRHWHIGGDHQHLIARRICPPRELRALLGIVGQVGLQPTRMVSRLDFPDRFDD